MSTRPAHWFPKVHVEAERHAGAGKEIILIGHAGHPEVIGTMGQTPEGSMHLVETAEDARTFTPRNPDQLAFVTQTTLSVDDTAEIVSILQDRFPSIASPHKEDICYATTNRQNAVKAMGAEAELTLVIGAETSSNSKRLVEVALREGSDDDGVWSQVQRMSTGAGLTGSVRSVSPPEQARPRIWSRA